MRATYLGSNPVTALLRCACGRRLLFHKETWQNAGFLPCDNCRQKICYKNLRLFPELTGGYMAQSELEQLRLIEEQIRDFVKYFDRHVAAAEQRGSTLHPFAPGTVEAVEKLRGPLGRLDQMRVTVSGPD